MLKTFKYKEKNIQGKKIQRGKKRKVLAGLPTDQFKKSTITKNKKKIKNNMFELRIVIR